MANSITFHKMKILLLGEYSNVHNTLAKGLRRLGHQVTVASDGDSWKDYPRDIDLKRDLCSRTGRISFLWRLMKALPSMRGYDIVQIINPIFFELKDGKQAFLFVDDYQILVFVDDFQPLAVETLFGGWFADFNNHARLKGEVELCRLFFVDGNDFVGQHAFHFVAADTIEFLHQKLHQRRWFRDVELQRILL